MANDAILVANTFEAEPRGFRLPGRRQRPALRLALGALLGGTSLGSTLGCAAIGTSESPSAHRAPTTEARRLEACLERARTHLAEAEITLERMRRELAGFAPERRCRPMDPRAPFRAFEGRWSGHWGDMPVEHLWKTVAPGVQLVVIRDGKVPKPGINLREGKLLCGIVVEADGRERLHSGRFVAAGGEHGPHLEWRSGHHIYRESVTCHAGQRRYEIRESVRTGAGYEPGVSTHYAPPMAPMRLAGGPR